MSQGRAYDVCVLGGLGHIGLPLGIAFAKAGKRVVLYDINDRARKQVSLGEMPFLEVGAQDILKSVINKTLFISGDISIIRECQFIVVVIGTPVDEHLNPQFAVFKNLFDELNTYLDNDQHVILRSTVFPGSTEKIHAYLQSKEKKTGVSFCPERIAQGKAMRELYTLPQIIAPCDVSYAHEIEELFLLITKKCILLRPIEAELAKLYTNAWRYVQFATANQFYQLAEQNGVDFHHIYEAMTQNYPRTQGMPSAGFAAGPCLFKDTMQLAAYGNNTFFLGHAAMLVNEGMPNFVINQLKKKYDLSEKVVGILGMAFKANNDDKRESLSYKLKKILSIEANRILCSDVYIKDQTFVTPEELISQSDIIIIGVPHDEYQGLNIPSGKNIVDMWNMKKDFTHESVGNRVSRVYSGISC